MKRREFLRNVAGASAAALFSRHALAQGNGNGNDVPPNIVLIISDDQDWEDYSFMGHPHIQTPHLDRLAEQSLLFTRGWVASPLCCPSLGSMITGLHPHQNKITSNDPPFDDEGVTFQPGTWSEERIAKRRRMEELYTESPTLPRLLSDKGYLSHQSGKWWGGHYSNGGFTHGMTHGDLERGGRHGDEGLTIGREGMDPVFDFIEVAGETPFFLWFAPFLPHTPHNPPDRLMEKYVDKHESFYVARYWAMCEWWDEVCGELLDHLDEQGLADNTMVLYICDNGWIQQEDSPRFEPGSKRAPLDAGARTPVMVRWPGKVTPRRDETTLVNSVDLAPTILEAIGLSPTSEMQGINLLDQEALEAREANFSAAYTHDHVDIERPVTSLMYLCVQQGEWKLILPNTDNTDTDYPQLYNVFEDPREQENLAEDQPERVPQLRAVLRDWWPEGEAACIET